MVHLLAARNSLSDHDKDLYKRRRLIRGYEGRGKRMRFRACEARDGLAARVSVVLDTFTCNSVFSSGHDVFIFCERGAPS